MGDVRVVGGGVEQGSTLATHFDAGGNRDGREHQHGEGGEQAGPATPPQAGADQHADPTHVDPTVPDDCELTICPSRMWMIRSDAAATSTSWVTITMV